MNSPYSPDFIEARKEELETQKRAAETELAEVANFDDSSGTYIAKQPELEQGSVEDVADNGLESEIWQTHQSRVADLERTLFEVTKALERIEQGTYGVCETSGDWIEEDRLKAYPAATSCSNHAS